MSDDNALWAAGLISSRKKRGKSAPLKVDLQAAVLDVKITDVMQGASTIELTLVDPGWQLTDSGFFDVDDNGRPDPIEVNYPKGSKYWWRLHGLSIGDTQGEDGDITMTFMEREAVVLMHTRGPVKDSRSKHTRAEFIRRLALRIKPVIHFHSKELHRKQKVAAVPHQKQESKRSSDKESGINGKEHITFSNWDGSSYTFKKNELRNAEIVLDEATTHTQDEKALLALLCACIVEAPMFRNPAGGDKSSVGILQLLNIHLGGSVSARRNIPLVVRLFLDKGFSGRGGAIALSKAHPAWSPGRIAQAVQGSNFPDRYDKVRDGAVKVLRAYGGSTGITTTFRKQYHFQIGTQDAPREDYWTGMQRLADEVKWPLFFDGPDMYFDPETELIRQKPALVVRRGDSNLLTFSCDWDGRHIATEATFDLLCEPTAFRAGNVVKLEGYGPASSGSTAKLPGRWLISQIDRSINELKSTFTLKQPEAPAPEPAPDVGTRSFHGDFPGGGSGDTSDIRQASEVISHQNRAYSYGGGHGVTLASIGPHQSLDCSSSVSLALKKAGMFPPSVAWVSGQIASSWGEPGRGSDFTVWANADHVFLQSESGKAWRFDTSGGPPSGPHVREAHRSTAGFTPRHWKGR